MPKCMWQSGRAQFAAGFCFVCMEALVGFALYCSEVAVSFACFPLL